MDWFDFSGKSIKRLREELNVSQKKLGDLIGIPQQRVHDWEHNGVPNDPLLRNGLMTSVRDLQERFMKTGVIK